MAQDDEAARKSRAEKIREQISSLKNPDEVGDDKAPRSPEDPNKSQGGKSPRDFIHERMRDLDEADRDN